MTNFEKIKQMSKQELLNLLHGILGKCLGRGMLEYEDALDLCFDCPMRDACDSCDIEKWLKSEVETE